MATMIFSLAMFCYNSYRNLTSISTPRWTTGTGELIQMQPLEGKIIGITRDAAQAGSLAAALRARGAEPLLCPTIAIAPPASWQAVDAVLEEWPRVAWVLFPSANAVTFFLGRLRQRLPGPAVWSGKRVGAVGSATRDLLAAAGISVDVVPARFTGAALAAELATGQPVPEGLVVIPASDIAREELAGTLAAAGWPVRQVQAYRTVTAAPPSDTLVRLPDAQAVTFASPSAVQGFRAAAGDDFFRRHPHIVAASIGPSTTRALAAAAPPRLVEASPHTVDGLIEALEVFFRQRIDESAP
jgi:uroporphyrinogen III methyltransferase/synthase